MLRRQGNQEVSRKAAHASTCPRARSCTLIRCHFFLRESLLFNNLVLPASGEVLAQVSVVRTIIGTGQEPRNCVASSADHSPLRIETSQPLPFGRRWLDFVWRLVFGVLIALPALSHAVTPAAARSIKYESDMRVTSYVAQLPPPSSPFSTTERSDDELLILQMLLGSYILSEGIFGYPKQGSLILPLTDLVAALDFPIEVDPENGTAEGWFIDENRLFSLDLAASQVVIAGEVIPLDPAFVEQLPDDIYVDVRTLAQWFPIDFRFDLPNLVLSLTSREPLPLEARLLRELERDRMLSQRRSDSRKLPKIEVPYEWITWPVSDTTLEFNLSSTDGKSEFTRSYSTLATADLLKLNADLFISGTDKDQIGVARLKLGRQEDAGGLLGKLDATQFAVGDVFSPQIKHMSRSQVGRGFEVSNAPIGDSNEFDRITLQGDLQLGWEVELYRNEVLLDFRQSQTDGRYLFEDVPLLFGVNVVKLVFYGPQGQRREEIQQLRVGPDQIKPGGHQYLFSFNQEDRLLLMGDDKTIQDQSFQGKARYAAQYKFGISKNFSVGTNLASIPFEGGHRVYTGANLVTSLGPIYARTDITKDIEGGWAATLSAQTSLFGINIIGEHTYLNDFLSEEFDNDTDPQETDSRIRLDGVFRLGFLPHIPYSVNVNHQSFKSRDRSTQVQNRLSTAIGRASVSNTLSLNFSDPAELSDSEDMNGTLQLGGSIGPVRTRGQISYSVIPETKFTSVALSGDWSLNKKFNARAGVSRQLSGSDDMSLSLGVNTDLDYVAAGVDSTISDKGDYSGKLRLTYSWGKDAADGGLRLASKPTAERGTMTTRVFLDLDGNGVYDPEIDEALEGVGFVSGRTKLEAKTNEKGLAFVTSLGTFKAVPFEVDVGTLEDPFWITDPEGVQVILRPGVPGHVDFPVVTTGEIDGVAYIRKDGLSETASDVVIQLIDEEGEIAKQTRSQYDGFFLIDLIRPGTYTMRVDPEQLQRLDLPAVAERTVVIGRDGTILNGEDIVIGDAGPEPQGLVRAYLASFASQELAEEAWAEVVATFPETFKGVDPEYNETTSASGEEITNLFGIPFADRKAAENACIGLRAEYGNTWCNPLEISIR